MKELISQLIERKYTSIDCRTSDGCNFDLYFDVKNYGSFRLKFNSNAAYVDILKAIDQTIEAYSRFRLQFKSLAEG